MASGVTIRCAWSGRGESFTELTPFGNFLLHLYTCVVTDMHHSTELPFVGEFKCISLLHFAKKNDRKLLPFCVCSSGAAIFTLLLRRRVAFLHRTATGRPLNKPWVSLCQLIRQSRCLSNFYQTFNVFIWLTFVFGTRHSSYKYIWAVLLHYIAQCPLVLVQTKDV